MRTSVFCGRQGFVSLGCWSRHGLPRSGDREAEVTGSLFTGLAPSKPPRVRLCVQIEAALVSQELPAFLLFFPVEAFAGLLGRRCLTSNPLLCAARPMTHVLVAVRVLQKDALTIEIFHSCLASQRCL